MPGTMETSATQVSPCGRRLHIAAFVRTAGGQGASFPCGQREALPGVPCVVLHFAIF